MMPLALLYKPFWLAGVKLVLPVFLLGFFTVPATAQLLGDPDPDWAELSSVPPPHFDLKRQVPFQITNSATELKWGIDPKTFSVGKDGISRYVVMAISASGVANVRYEGIRCAKSELKIYARWEQPGQWQLLENPQWQSLSAGHAGRHAQALARQALCDISVARTDINEIVRLLSSRSAGGRAP